MRLTPPGVYRQYDGSLLLWTPFWYGGQIEPTGAGQNCLMVRLATDLAGQWFDEPCMNARHYICERYGRPSYN